MRYGTSMVLLVLAAVLESGGDAPYGVGYPQPDDNSAFSISSSPAAWSWQPMATSLTCHHGNLGVS